MTTQTKWKSVDAEAPPPASFFKFEAFGDAIEGVFQGIEEETGQYGPQKVATIQTAKTEWRKVRVNYGLSFQLSTIKKGQAVRIAYKADGEAGINRKTGEVMSPPKLFSVDVAEGKYELPEIPF